MIPPPNSYPYWYTAQIAAAFLNGTAVTISTRFEEGTLFECHSLYAWTDLDVVGNFQSAMFLCKLADQGTGQQLSNGYVPRTAMFGSLDHLDGALPVPIQFSGKSTLQFDLQNVSGSTFNKLILTALGIRWRGTPMTVS